MGGWRDGLMDVVHTSEEEELHTAKNTKGNHEAENAALPFAEGSVNVVAAATHSRIERLTAFIETSDMFKRVRTLQ